MTCEELASCIKKMQPEAEPCQIARLCLLLCNFVDDLDDLKNEERLSRAWRDMMVRLEALTDQHAAMTNDLEELSRANPETLTLEQIMVLIRAIKVQSQVVQLYVGKQSKDSGFGI